MSDFKFSIIISAYNSEKWIKKSIESILTQTLNFKENIEIILINNGSKDNTHEICEEYALKYPENIKYICKKHEGNGINRNLGLAYAKGDYISFLNGEDYLSKNSLKNILKFFKEHENIDIVSAVPTFLNLKNNNEILKSKYEKSRIINLLENPEFIQVQTATCFFKRSTIKNVTFSEQLKLSEDIAFVNQILIDNPKMGICSECKYYIRAPKEQSCIILTR